jgi:cystathionine beta-lyase/cystathionine gamma-synthase
VARWAATQKWIAKVHYPGLDSHPDHAVAARVLGGFGGMVGLQLAGGVPAAERFLSRLRVVVHAPSLAGVESLISEPRITSHVHLSPEQRAALGFPDGFVRLSCGIEDGEDIIADLEQAGGAVSR